jgi:hypothetical protein
MKYVNKVTAGMSILACIITGMSYLTIIMGNQISNTNTNPLFQTSIIAIIMLISLSIFAYYYEEELQQTKNIK